VVYDVVHSCAKSPIVRFIPRILQHYFHPLQLVHSALCCLPRVSIASIIMTDQSRKEKVINFGAGPAKLPYEVY